MEGRKKIGDDFCFRTHHYDIKGTHAALTYYKANKKEKKEIICDTNVIIAVDTNLLLRLYEMSERDRSEMLRFFEARDARLIIPAQVQREFITHRSQIINGFIKNIDKERKEWASYVKNVKSSIEVFIEQADNFKKKKALADVIDDDIRSKIDELKGIVQKHGLTEEEKISIEEKSQRIESLLEGNTKSLLEKTDYIYDDPILKTLNKATILEELSTEEHGYLRSVYDRLLSKFNERKGEGNEEYFTFPGCGDRRKIKVGEDPTGDFVIYHELLAYMAQWGVDVYFLTLDVTKSDWVNIKGEQYVHYIIDSHVNTSHMLYILDASNFPVDIRPAEKQFEDEDNDVESNIDDNKNDEENDENEDINYDNNQGLTHFEQRLLNSLCEYEFWAVNFGAGYLSKYFFINRFSLDMQHKKGIVNKVLNKMIKLEYVEEYDNEEGKKCVRSTDKK